MDIMRMHDMIEKLSECAKCEIDKGIENIDPCEMGQVTDMMKDLAEAMYYRTLMKAMEECTIEAALTGDYGKALEAFVLNPLVENNENTTKVLDELLVAHAKYLPQFKEKIEELKAKGVHSTDPVVMDLMEHGH